MSKKIKKLKKYLTRALQSTSFQNPGGYRERHTQTVEGQKSLCRIEDIKSERLLQ